MKKLLIIFTLAGYLLMSIGVGVSRHYCQGYLASVSLLGTNPTACVCAWWAELQEKDNDCCHDEVAFFQIKTPHQVNQAISLPLALAPVVADLSLKIVLKGFDLHTAFHSSEAPLDIGSPPLFVKHHQWVLYG